MVVRRCKKFGIVTLYPEKDSDDSTVEGRRAASAAPQAAPNHLHVNGEGTH
jgi:hypothetical protein